MQDRHWTTTKTHFEHSVLSWAKNWYCVNYTKNKGTKYQCDKSLDILGQTYWYSIHALMAYLHLSLTTPTFDSPCGKGLLKSALDLDKFILLFCIELNINNWTLLTYNIYLQINDNFFHVNNVQLHFCSHHNYNITCPIVSCPLYLLTIIVHFTFNSNKQPLFMIFFTVQWPWHFWRNFNFNYTL